MRPFKAFVQAIRTELEDPAFRATLVLLLGLLIAGTVVYSVVEGWSPLDALYFSVVTLATVGYGDLHPVTDIGKIFTILFILTGVGVLVVFASRVVNSMVVERSATDGRLREQLHERRDHRHAAHPSEPHDEPSPGPGSGGGGPSVP